MVELRQPAPTNADAGAPASARETSAPAFAPGDLLAGRFRIVRFLAEGGMGQVYEAEDLELGGSVALKTIRMEISEDEHARERFRREITLARKVTHPNVCRVFDAYRHPLQPGGGRRVTFLAMELLSGETLADRLRRGGPMSPGEALPLVEQMARGLQAAHEAGVIHRDFKPANVILVPGPDRPRAVVTDFGLARGHEEAASLSGTGPLGMVGTSAYMSPEQVEGRPVGPASDVYALGVVLYEMMTGVKPFSGDTLVATAVMRLREPPLSPRRHRPDLDARWEAAILRCLALRPDHRFAHVADVPAALTAPIDSGTTVPAAFRAVSRRRAVFLAGAAVVAAAFALSGDGPRRPAALPATPRAVAAPRRALALLGFKNLSGRAEAAWLSTALAEMLGMELAAGEKLRIIPGENVARMKVDLSLADADSLAADTLARIRSHLGTDLVVLGSFLSVGDDALRKIRVDLRVQDTQRGELVASVTETGNESELLDLVARGGGRLRAALEPREASPTPGEGVRASLPANPQAARLYSEGLARLRRFDPLAARDLLQKAVAADGDYALAHAALADAWFSLGHDREAVHAATRALELSGRLPREERLSVEGRHHAVARQWAHAIDTYRVLWGFFPDNVEYGLRLAEVQTSAGRSREALATLDALRLLPPPVSPDPRIDLAESNAAGMLADRGRQLSAAARAVQKGDAQGSPLLAAEARLSQGRALREVGRPEEAIAAHREAQRVFARAGDQRGVAAALYGVGVTQFDRARLDEAVGLFRESLAMEGAIGHRRGVARSLSAIGSVQSVRGEHDAAMVTYHRALAIHQETGDLSSRARTLHSLAYTQFNLGDIGEAVRNYEQSLALARELGDASMEAATQNDIAAVRWERGDGPAVLRIAEEALATNRRLGQKSREARNLANIGWMLHDMADAAGARRSHERSAQMRRQLGEIGMAMENQVGLAAILFEEGRLAEAEAALRPALEHFRAVDNVGEEAEALARLVDCLLARSDVANARRAGERAAGLARRDQSWRVRRIVDVKVARVDAASGAVPRAIAALERVIEDSRRRGFARIELEGRLALARIETEQGNAARGRVLLDTVARQAAEKGFTRIVRRAEAAAAPKSVQVP
jgi:tetratricopeptide (TPR) repeat protein